MRIDVSQQLKSPIGTIQNYEVSEVIDILGDGSNSSVQGKVSLMRTSRGILASGTLHTDTEVTCSRCLELYSCPLTVKIEEEYFPVTDVVTSMPLPLPYRLQAGHRVRNPLRPRQNICVLERNVIPMKIQPSKHGC